MKGTWRTSRIPARWQARSRRSGALGEIGLLARAPALLALTVIVGAIGNRYAFDFHGALWQAARDVLDGRNPYPPATAAGVAPGDRFVYPPPVAILLVPLGALPFPLAAAIITVVLIAAVAATLACSACATGAATAPRTSRSRSCTTSGSER